MDTLLLAYSLGLLLCICGSYFFSSSEMAYSSCNRLRLENALEAGDKRAGRALSIVDRFDNALSAILIGNNLVNIAASSIGSVMIYYIFGDQTYAWVATAVITVLVIIFGETMPKIVAKANPNKIALDHAGFIRGLTILLMPVIWLVVGLVKLITGRMKGEAEENDEDTAREELSSIIETAEDEAVLDEDQSELVQAAIDFSEIPAFEVMTARVDMIALDIDDPWEEQLALLESSPYSRIPVFEDSVDHIIGILYLNHFFKATLEQEKPDIRSLLMPTCYVYKTMKLPAVMAEFRKAQQHLSVVTDEYGGTLGLISMEDVMEQLVGEIWDETDEVEEEVVERQDGHYELDGDMVISDFLELLGIRENEFEADSETVGGWAIEMYGAFPKIGDSFRYGPWKVTVLDTDGLRVEKLLVEPAEE